MKTLLLAFFHLLSISVFAFTEKDVLVINSSTQSINTPWLNMLGNSGLSYDLRSFETLDSLGVILNYRTILYLDDDVNGGNYLTGTRKANLVSALKNQRSLYIQSEYQASYQTNVFFDQLCDSAGGTFSWNGITSGMFNSVAVLAPFNTVAVEVNSISGFWYGQTATFDNTIVKPFLVDNGTTLGFYIDSQLPGFGKVVTVTDRDFYTGQNTSAMNLLKNITYYLLNYSTLPVELSFFTAKLTGDRVMLNWATASETNNAGWEIQRAVPEALEGSASGNSNPGASGTSGSGLDWETIGFVAGKGTTTESQNYEFSSPVTRDLSPVTLRLKQLDLDGTVSYSQMLTLDITPTAFSLEKNYPNPFNPSTNIRFFLPQSGPVKLVVFDLLGREVVTLVNKEMEAGGHSVVFEANSLSAGLYFARISFGGKVMTQKMTLLK